MNKLTFFTITSLLFSAHFLFAQDSKISGRILTGMAFEPLPYVEISIKGKNIGTITNREGNFVLTGDLSPSDSIIVTHLAFETKTIGFSDLTNEGNTIVLTPRSILFEEVTIQGQNVVSLIREALLISRNSIILPLRLETYYREFVKENQRYTKFSDGILDYDMLGRTDKLKTRVCVKQSRANAIKTESDKEIDWDLNSPLDIQKALDPFLLGRLNNVIENADKYDFQMKTLNEKNSNGQIEIRFNPKSDTKELLYEGKVLIDKLSKYILSFNYRLEKNESKPFKEINLIIVKARITQFSSMVMFRLKNQNYQPWYTNTQVGMKIWNKKKINETFSFLSDLLVFEVVNTPFEEISGKDVFKKKALYSLGDNFQLEFWKDQNSMLLTSEEENIIKQLQ